MSRAKHVLRWSMKCRLGGEIDYDPNEPGSYKKALQAVQEKRAQLEAMSGIVTAVSMIPVKTRAEH